MASFSSAAWRLSLFILSSRGWQRVGVQSDDDDDARQGDGRRRITSDCSWYGWDVCLRARVRATSMWMVNGLCQMADKARLLVCGCVWMPFWVVIVASSPLNWGAIV